jgi:hypothetical protein
VLVGEAVGVATDPAGALEGRGQRRQAEAAAIVGAERDVIVDDRVAARREQRVDASGLRGRARVVVPQRGQERVGVHGALIARSAAAPGPWGSCLRGDPDGRALPSSRPAGALHSRRGGHRRAHQFARGSLRRARSARRRRHGRGVPGLRSRGRARGRAQDPEGHGRARSLSLQARVPRAVRSGPPQPVPAPRAPHHRRRVVLHDGAGARSVVHRLGPPQRRRRRSGGRRHRPGATADRRRHPAAGAPAAVARRHLGGVAVAGSPRGRALPALRWRPCPARRRQAAPRPQAVQRAGRRRPGGWCCSTSGWSPTSSWPASITPTSGPRSARRRTCRPSRPPTCR